MTTATATTPRRIALVGWGEFGRRVSVGAVRFTRPSRPWAFCEAPERGDVFAYLRRLRPDGVILYASNDQFGRRALRLQCPVVNVSARLSSAVPLTTVCVDSAAASGMAADYFLTRGFRHFAFAELGGPTHRLRAAYQTALDRVGLTAAEWRQPRPDWYARFLADPLSEHLLAPPRRWLRELPKPVAVLCDHDLLAAALATVCAHSSIAVPEEVAIVGVGNDVLRCEKVWPPVSSVDLNVETVGYRAAELLDRLIHGGPPPHERIYVAPRGVVTRLSSDIAVVTDITVGRAIRYITAHLHEPLAVDAIAAGSGVGRRTLERRFREYRGHSVRHQIHLARLERARQLLSETDEPVVEVAERAGFGNLASFYTLFRQHTGRTPGEFRAAHQA